MKKSQGGEASEVDMISKLPDPILHLILSRLPTTEEVMRTSILSTRWRYLWTSVPSINIHYSRGSKSLKENKEKRFEEFVCRVLANKSIDLDSFRLNSAFYSNMSTIRRWIDAAVRRNVKLLDLRFFPMKEDEDIEVPNCPVSCGSLEVLRLTLFGFRLILPTLTAFPALRILKLKSCKVFRDNFFEDFLRSCPLLDDLSLVEVDCMTYYLGPFCISCPNLKNLKIDSRKNQDCGMCHRLQICCPKLVFLEFAGFMGYECIFGNLDSMKTVVIHPPDIFKWRDNNVCELFAGFSHVEFLFLHICLWEKCNDLEDIPGSLPNLKTLELTTTMDAFNMDVVIRILISSLNLESLHLVIQQGQLQTSFPTEDDDLEFWERDHDCIFETLKMVKMRGMSSLPHHMRFIKFLLESSPVLETMSITPCVYMTTDQKLRFSVELLGFRRALLEAKIIFVQGQV